MAVFEKRKRIKDPKLAPPLPPSAVMSFPRTQFEEIQEFGQRVIARDMFVNKRMTIEEISVHLRISSSRVAQWGLEGRWEEKQLALNTTTDQAAEIMENKLFEIIRAMEYDHEPPTEHLARMITYWTKAIAALRADKQTFRGILSSMLIFVEFVKMTDPQILEKLNPLIEGFLETRRKQANL
jgi:hypothetical protein